MRGSLLSITTGARHIPAFVLEEGRSRGCLIVLHEVTGLVPHIKDVCIRLSKLGFTTLAPDLYWRYKDLLLPDKILTAMRAVWGLALKERYDLRKVKDELVRMGNSKETFEVVSTLYNQGFRDQMLRDSVFCARYAQSKYGKVGSIGFCMGGGLSMRLATRFSSLAACVSFYGEPPDPKDVPRIRSPILSIFAENDEIINSNVPPFVEAAISSGKDLTLKVYPNTRHGFFNDTSEERYNKEAAKDAWELTSRFFERTMARGQRDH